MRVGVGFNSCGEEKFKKAAATCDSFPGEGKVGVSRTMLPHAVAIANWKHR